MVTREPSSPEGHRILVIGPSVAALIENYDMALEAADTAVQTADASH